MRQRGFEIVSGYYRNAIIPTRSTKNSAGYDFYAVEDIVIPDMYPTLVKTGIKAFMRDDEVLMLYNRSSNAKRRGLILANGVGVVDSDYYENPENEGEIMFMFINITDTPCQIKKGDKIGQGVFTKFLKIDNEELVSTERSGGFGSTGD